MIFSYKLILESDRENSSPLRTAQRFIGESPQQYASGILVHRFRNIEPQLSNAR
jgi:hypothetical protein